MIWSNYRYNSQRIKLQKQRLELSEDPNHRILSSDVQHYPRRIEDLLFFVTKSGDSPHARLIVYDIKQGDQQILYDFGSNPSFYPFSDFEIILDDGLFTTGGGNVYKIDLKTGDLVDQITHPLINKLAEGWEYLYFKNLAIIEDNRMFFSGSFSRENHYLSAYDFSNKSLLWEKSFDKAFQCLSKSSHLILQYNNSDILCHNSESGINKWTYESQDYITTDLLIVETQIIFGVADGRIISLNLENGEQNWEIMTPLSQTHSLCYYNDNSLHLITYSHYCCLNSNDGSILNSFTIEESEWKRIGVTGQLTKVEVTDTHVLSCDINESIIFAINRTSGKIDWHFNLGINATIPLDNHPLIIENSIYVLDFKGQLHEIAM